MPTKIQIVNKYESKLELNKIWEFSRYNYYETQLIEDWTSTDWTVWRNMGLEEYGWSFLHLTNRLFNSSWTLKNI